MKTGKIINWLKYSICTLSWCWNCLSADLPRMPAAFQMAGAGSKGWKPPCAELPRRRAYHLKPTPLPSEQLGLFRLTEGSQWTSSLDISTDNILWSSKDSICSCYYFYSLEFLVFFNTFPNSLQAFQAHGGYQLNGVRGGRIYQCFLIKRRPTDHFFQLSQYGNSLLLTNISANYFLLL